MSRKLSISGRRCPSIFLDYHVAPTLVYHRLYGEHHALLQPDAGAPYAKVGYLRLLMQMPADTVAHKIPHHGKPFRFYERLDSRGNIMKPRSLPDLAYALVEGLLRHCDQLQR